MSVYISVLGVPEERDILNASSGGSHNVPGDSRMSYWMPFGVTARGGKATHDGLLSSGAIHRVPSVVLYAAQCWERSVWSQFPSGFLRCIPS